MLVALSPILVEWKNRICNEERILRRINKAAQNKADVICFPEYCITGYNYLFDNESAKQAININNDPFVNKIKAETKDKNIDIIFGCLEQDDEDIFNSSLYISNGEILGKHRKIMEGGPISKGKTVDCFKTKLGSVSMILCSDIFNDFIIAELVKKQPDIVFMPMDRCLGKMDFCSNFKNDCDDLDCEKEDSSKNCYKPEYSDHIEAWNKRAKLDYCSQVQKYGCMTIIVNVLDNNHEKACGGALFINKTGKIVNEVNYGSDTIHYIKLD